MSTFMLRRHGLQSKCDTVYFSLCRHCPLDGSRANLVSSNDTKRGCVGGCGRVHSIAMHSLCSTLPNKWSLQHHLICTHLF